MIPELGHFALVLALALALVQALLGLAGGQSGRPEWIAAVRPAAFGQFTFVALAFAALTWSFVQNDFTVQYVASNSNTALPVPYRVAAVWGAHEGSLLFWILVLSMWTVAVATFSVHLPATYSARVLGVLGLISVGFALFTLETSNPFVRLPPGVLEGRDLNPVLQDPALAIHPPMLYTGYVGFAVAFAFAIAAMLEGRLDSAWSRWTRPWTTIAWAFLTVGIALGSWWAYYELGWGGWWFWDPVENASFMPWLAGTALIHSLAVSEKRGLFKSWTLLLAISAFSLSLLGTFLVRSGVLVSVHSFASDPARGTFILLFLVLVVGGALVLYAWRAPQLDSDARFAVASRETFILVNNLLLVVATAVILLGTLFPLFYEAFGPEKISVGVPYFEYGFAIAMAPLITILAVGMHAAWKKARQEDLMRTLRWPLGLAVVLGIAVPWLVFGHIGALTVFAIVMGLWIVFSALLEPLTRFRRGRGVPATVLGMTLAHIGVGVFTIGVAVTKSYSVELDTAMQVGEVQEIGELGFRFDGVVPSQGPNYEAVVGTVTVLRGDDVITTLYPEKRVYRVQKSPMTEADIDGTLARDLFAALGEDLGASAWSVRLQFKPMIRMIWLGALLMAIGGVVAACDRRYRARTASRSPGAAPRPATAVSAGQQRASS
ncbi:MAG: heme lyase CcmF/NrfE family subunit [Pseudomonadota bacterium]